MLIDVPLWEPTPWAMGVAHVLKTIAHGVGSHIKSGWVPFLPKISKRRIHWRQAWKN